MGYLILIISWTILILNILSVLIMIFIKRKDLRSVQSWILAFLILPPGISLCIYFLLGSGPKFNKQKVKLRKINVYKKITPLFILNDSIESFDNIDMNTTLSQFNNFHPMFQFTSNNNIKIFDDAYKKFNELIEDIKNARETIHLVYYIIRSDTLGSIILNLLTEKARQGIKVRLIYDYSGSISSSKKMFDNLKNAGGEVYSFFPAYFKFMHFNLNYRNHKKIVIIDGKIGYIGGMNIGNEYLSLKNNLSPWKDCHSKITGDAVKSLQLQFIDDLSYVCDHKIETEENFIEKYFPKSKETKKTFIQIVGSDPSKQNYEKIKLSYLRMIYTAKKEIYIQSPYLALDDSFIYALISSAQSGVTVNIMLPKLYDRRFVYRVTTSYIKQFLDAGINIYFYDGFIHSKVMFSDNSFVSLGTVNLNIRSFSLNFEVNAFILDSHIAETMKKIFYKDIEKCIKIDYSYCENKSLLLKIEESFWRLFIPIF